MGRQTEAKKTVSAMSERDFQKVVENGVCLRQLLDSVRDIDDLRSSLNSNVLRGDDRKHQFADENAQGDHFVGKHLERDGD